MLQQIMRKQARCRRSLIKDSVSGISPL